MSTKTSNKINTSPLVKTYTLEEFWQLPDPPDRSKLELIAGVLYMSPPPEYTHDDVVRRLNRVLTLHLADTGDKGNQRREDSHLSAGHRRILLVFQRQRGTGARPVAAAPGP